MSEGALLWLIVPAFAIGFPLFWCAVVGVIAAVGWRRLAAGYRATSDPPPSAERFGWASMFVGAANYRSGINAWLSESGMWLRPVFVFRPFHPMLFIPWARVRAVESKGKSIFARVHMTLAGKTPELVLAGALGRAVLNRFSSTQR